MIGRLLVSRLTLHFGRQHGWHYLINGNIKDEADYIFFVKSYDAETIIPPGFVPFNGYDTPKTSDAYAIMFCGNDRLRMVNFKAGVGFIFTVSVLFISRNQNSIVPRNQ